MKNKKIILFCLVLILSFMLFGCSQKQGNSVSSESMANVSDIHSDNIIETEVSSDAYEESIQTDSSNDISLQDTDSQPKQSSDDGDEDDVTFQSLISNDFKAYSAVNTSTGESEPLNIAFGSSYTQYGSSLSFSDDGTFAIYVGAYADNGFNSGKYKVNGNEIQVSYDNDNTDTFTIKYNDSGEIDSIVTSYHGYTVYFN